MRDASVTDAGRPDVPVPRVPTEKELPLLPRVLVAASSAIMVLLGALHLLYTFRGSNLAPRDPSLRTAMDTTHMVLTTETTVWRAWIGFNASHGICAALFGLVFGYLALVHPDLFFRSLYLQLLGLGVLVAFVVLARLYWFSVPLAGVGVALACYAAGLALARAQA